MKELVTGRKGYSMKWRLVGILLLCWLIPFSVMFGMLVVYVASNHGAATAENFHNQLEFNNMICMERLNAAVEASRQASYDGQLLNTHSKAEEGKLTKLEARKACMKYLEAHYLKNTAASCTFLWFYSDPGELYSVYNVGAEGSYQKTKTFQDSDFEEIREYAKKLGTRVGFLLRDRRLYLIRNLVDSSFEEKGVLVMRVNKEYCFRSLAQYPTGDGVFLKLNELELDLYDRDGQVKMWAEAQGKNRKDYVWSKRRLYVTDKCIGNSFELETVMRLQKEITKYPFYGYQYVMGGLLFSLIPLLAVMISAVRRQVTLPVQLLSEGARHIENGELGYQVREISSNREFSYLRENFNKMSGNLKQQFDRIYEEEVALREAKIMALQSHINPHFLNNTLEIINWEARLNGDFSVSGMIEALSNVLDAALDRRKCPEVLLAEEMRYVNSYLYITKERLGDRLTVKIDMPEEILDCKVPRLILQPVIENAIEHGVVPNKTGMIWIRGYHDEVYLYLETQNDGGLTQEDKEKIACLLASDYSSQSEKSGNLGIANVNQRLRILFGEPCGLSITEMPAGYVCAKLTIPFRKKGTESV
ncbi:MAG: sensor histidine kinase [Marvinbryantia sp.]|jgi:two-component system sensor histidine kinase YesM